MTDGGSIQVLPWGIKQKLFISWKHPLLLHSKVRQFSFNCPQQVKGKSRCFTLKWVNTNNCFCNLAEWSVRPDITQTVVKTLLLISAVYICSCRSLRTAIWTYQTDNLFHGHAPSNSFQYRSQLHTNTIKERTFMRTFTTNLQ